MNITQEVLMYITCFFMLLSAWRGFRGAGQFRRFEQKHWNMLRLTGFLTYLNLGIVLVLVLRNIFEGGNPELFLQLEVLVMFFVAVWVSLGMGKIRSTLIHGKKFAAVFLYFGVALLVMILLLCYLKLWKYAHFIF